MALEYSNDLLSPALAGMSALLTTIMVQMNGVIEAMKQAGLRDKVKVMVGERR